MDVEILKNIGLSDNESEVYRALLASGDASVLEISERAHKNRTHTYDLLRSLVEKGLASYTVLDSKRHFRAMPPQRLVDTLDDKEKEILRQKEELQKALPELLKLQHAEKGKARVEMYSEKEGIKTIYNEILRSAKEYAILGATGKITRALEFYFPHHEKERVKKKIHLRILCNPALRHEEIARGRAYCDVKFLPREVSSPVPTLLFKDSVVILIWEELSAIVLESKSVAEAYRMYFELLWKNAER